MKNYILYLKLFCLVFPCAINASQQPNPRQNNGDQGNRTLTLHNQQSSQFIKEDLDGQKKEKSSYSYSLNALSRYILSVSTDKKLLEIHKTEAELERAHLKLKELEEQLFKIKQEKYEKEEELKNIGNIENEIINLKTGIGEIKTEDIKKQREEIFAPLLDSIQKMISSPEKSEKNNDASHYSLYVKNSFYSNENNAKSGEELWARLNKDTIIMLGSNFFSLSDIKFINKELSKTRKNFSLLSLSPASRIEGFLWVNEHSQVIFQPFDFSLRGSITFFEKKEKDPSFRFQDFARDLLFHPPSSVETIEREQCFLSSVKPSPQILLPDTLYGICFEENMQEVKEAVLKQGPTVYQNFPEMKILPGDPFEREQTLKSQQASQSNGRNNSFAAGPQGGKNPAVDYNKEIEKCKQRQAKYRPLSFYKNTAFTLYSCEKESRFFWEGNLEEVYDKLCEKKDWKSFVYYLSACFPSFSTFQTYFQKMVAKEFLTPFEKEFLCQALENDLNIAQELSLFFKGLFEEENQNIKKWLQDVFFKFFGKENFSVFCEGFIKPAINQQPNQNFKEKDSIIKEAILKSICEDLMTQSLFSLEDRLSQSPEILKDVLDFIKARDALKIHGKDELKEKFSEKDSWEKCDKLPPALQEILYDYVGKFLFNESMKIDYSAIFSLERKYKELTFRSKNQLKEFDKIKINLETKKQEKDLKEHIKNTISTIEKDKFYENPRAFLDGTIKDFNRKFPLIGEVQIKQEALPRLLIAMALNIVKKGQGTKDFQEFYTSMDLSIVNEVLGLVLAKLNSSEKYLEARIYELVNGRTNYLTEYEALEGKITTVQEIINLKTAYTDLLKINLDGIEEKNTKNIEEIINRYSSVTNYKCEYLSLAILKAMVRVENLRDFTDLKNHFKHFRDLESLPPLPLKQSLSTYCERIEALLVLIKSLEETFNFTSEIIIPSVLNKNTLMVIENDWNELSAALAYYYFEKNKDLLNHFADALIQQFNDHRSNLQVIEEEKNWKTAVEVIKKNYDVSFYQLQKQVQKLLTESEAVLSKKFSLSFLKKFSSFFTTIKEQLLQREKSIEEHIESTPNFPEILSLFEKEPNKLNFRGQFKNVEFGKIDEEAKKIRSGKFPKEESIDIGPYTLGYTYFFETHYPIEKIEIPDNPMQKIDSGQSVSFRTYSSYSFNSNNSSSFNAQNLSKEKSVREHFISQGDYRLATLLQRYFKNLNLGEMNEENLKLNFGGTDAERLKLNKVISEYKEKVRERQLLIKEELVTQGRINKVEKRTLRDNTIETNTGQEKSFEISPNLTGKTFSVDKLDDFYPLLQEEDLEKLKEKIESLQPNSKFIFQLSIKNEPIISLWRDETFGLLGKIENFNSLGQQLPSIKYNLPFSKDLYPTFAELIEEFKIKKGSLVGKKCKDIFSILLKNYPDKKKMIKEKSQKPSDSIEGSIFPWDFQIQYTTFKGRSYGTITEFKKIPNISTLQEDNLKAIKSGHNMFFSFGLETQKTRKKEEEKPLENLLNGENLRGQESYNYCGIDPSGNNYFFKGSYDPWVTINESLERRTKNFKTFLKSIPLGEHRISELKLLVNNVWCPLSFRRSSLGFAGFFTTPFSIEKIEEKWKTKMKADNEEFNLNYEPPQEFE